MVVLPCRLESSDAGPADDDDDVDIALKEAHRRRSLCHFCVMPVVSAAENWMRGKWVQMQMRVGIRDFCEKMS